MPESLARRKNNTIDWSKRKDRYYELARIDEDTVRMEFEHWCEMELLSRQYELFKSGRADDTADAGDEEAA